MEEAHLPTVDLPLQKISIQGPTLASLLHRFSSSAGDLEGLLFGTVTSSPPSLSDDAPSNDSPSLDATVTAFFCSTASSFHTSSGHLRRRALSSMIGERNPQSTLIGWFSGRRKTPLRPSMRETKVSSALDSFSKTPFPMENPSVSFIFTPCIFLLLTTPVQDTIAHHVHEYRAYQYRSSIDSFDVCSMGILNLGPGFRGHYGGFSSVSPFPVLHCEFRDSSSEMLEERDEESRNCTGDVAGDQEELDKCAEGFEIGKLSRLIGSEATNYTSGLENLYEEMLKKLEGLAQLERVSSAKVLEKENHVRSLRNDFAASD